MVKQTGHCIKSVQIDNAKEFLSLTRVLHNFGIVHRLTCPHTQEQNGSIDSKHRHIVDTGLALLSSSSLPLKYWGEAFNSVVHIINLFPTPMLNNISPYEKLFLLKPDYNFLNVFGCACYPLLRPYNQYKFDFRSSLFLFLTKVIFV